MSTYTLLHSSLLHRFMDLSITVFSFILRLPPQAEMQKVSTLYMQDS